MERETIKEIKTADRILRIFADESPESPREWDNLGTMVCSHRRYDLGDKQDIINFNDYNGWEVIETALIKKHDAAIVLPLYLYDHSGITMKTSPFGDRWDSGQVGFIYISKDKIRKEYSVKRMNKTVIEKATKCLEGEIETYDQYIRGDVYGFEVVKVEKCDKGCEHEEHEDSCYGFYGSDFKENGITGYLDKELSELLLAD